MESPRIHGGAEENSSCESGWTMYIEDTFHSHVAVYDDDDDDDDNDQSNERDPGDDGDDNDEDGDDDDDDSEDDGEEESDDSMASDASSWPSSQHLKNTKKHAAKKVQKTEKRACEMFSDKRDESELNAKTRNTAASRVQSRGKVSKTK